MAWRFKASKYKNAAPIVPKPEACVRDIIVGSYQTYGNNIAASAAFMAFNVDHNGSSLAVLPIDDCGRKSKTMPLLHAHTDTVTDMEFSPFHDGLLATGSQDCHVKVWHIPESGLQESIHNPECTFHHKQRRVETVCFHPTADNLLTSTSFTTMTLWDILSEKELLANCEHPDVIQSLSWNKDGALLATSCKDRQVRVLDPRLKSDSLITHSTKSHQSIKESRVVWLGDQTNLITTGFDSGRQREVSLRDIRNFKEPVMTHTLDSSTGVMMPLFDPDTNMLFLAAKGDTIISCMEVADRSPYLIEGIRHHGEQTKGACLVPKRALNVMQGEVNRVLQLTSSSVIPIMYQVPRKSYREFHADLFPDTAGCQAQLSSTQWWEGHNASVPRISLDPAVRAAAGSGGERIEVHRGTLSAVRQHLETNPYKITPKGFLSKNKTSHPNNTKPKTEEIKQIKEIIVAQSNENGVHVQNGQNGQNSHNGPNGNSVEKGGNVVPPKPMPRRSSSISESEDASMPKPVARPRTASIVQATIIMDVSPPAVVPPVVTSVNPAMPISGGYKPRLGPKPFALPKTNFGGSTDGEKVASDFSFDKVFSVPPVPGNQDAVNGSNNHQTLQETNNLINTNDNDIIQIENIEKSPETIEEPFNVPFSSLALDESDLVKSDENSEKGEFDSSPADLSPNSANDSPTNSKPKTPTTAERRKLFEFTNPNSDETVVTTAVTDGVALSKVDDDDKLEDFERASLQRSSIAERRRLYENRSMSVQEDKKTANVSPTPLRRKDSFKKGLKEDEEEQPSKPVQVQRQRSLEQPKPQETVTTPTPKRMSTVFGQISKFRLLKGTPLHKSTHIENIRNVSRQISGECDGFHANPKHVAVPLAGLGGKIAIFDLNKTGKLPDGVIPTLVQGNTIMDFAWDPFDYSRLAVACDDGIIKIWLVPEDGLTEPTSTPASQIAAHSEKIYFIKFHPLAKDVLASASYDLRIRIWDLVTQTLMIELLGHKDQMFNMAWSPCGAFCATVCRDGKLRCYNPRRSGEPIGEGKGPAGSRGARIVWALDGNFLVVSCFDKASERQIQIFRSDDLSTPLNTIGLDVSPALLIPFYDEDSSTLFLTGKGDSTIYIYEVTDETPYLCPLTHHRCTTLHQGLSFLPKNVCDVRNVEFARALRLTNNTIEPLSFTVPRVKVDLFQDDIFPPTKETWVPVMNSVEWFSGMDKQSRRISLKPEGMDTLSSMQGIAASSTEKKASKSTGPGSFAGAQQPFNRLGWNSDMSGATKQKQDEIQRAVSSRMEVNLRLEQDSMEGVDDKEWDE